MKGIEMIGKVGYSPIPGTQAVSFKAVDIPKNQKEAEDKIKNTFVKDFETEGDIDNFLCSLDVLNREGNALEKAERNDLTAGKLYQVSANEDLDSSDVRLYAIKKAIDLQKRTPYIAIAEDVLKQNEKNFYQEPVEYLSHRRELYRILADSSEKTRDFIKEVSK